MICDKDVIIKEFTPIVLQTVVPHGAALICVYNNPTDYPGRYVARLFDGSRATHIIVLADSIEELRMSKPNKMSIIDRTSRDAEIIKEIWI